MSLSEDTVAQSSTAPVASLRHPGLVGTGHEWIGIERLVEGAERVGGMLIRSVQFKRLFASIIRFAPHKATVLIQGESGTGKELVARSLHSLGAVPNGPFVTFNCSNLVDSLAESQLFGHVKGAFTDAREDSLGYFRSANGGTLFLDEIGELPLKLQPKLLRAVEMHEVQPVGSSHSYTVDIRLVAASNRDLSALVKEGEFRDDLYYRPQRRGIDHPAAARSTGCDSGLRSATSSRTILPPLAAQRTLRRISRPAIEALCAYSWPGNVRELAHAVESAVLMSDGDSITVNELPSNVLEGREASTPQIAEAPGSGIPVEIAETSATAAPTINGAATGESKFSLDAAIREASKDALVRALNATHGNCHRAADLLGVSRYTVYRMLARYGLTESRGYRSWRKNPLIPAFAGTQRHLICRFRLNPRACARQVFEACAGEFPGGQISSNQVLQLLDFGAIIFAQPPLNVPAQRRERSASFQHVLDDPALAHPIRGAMISAIDKPSDHIARDLRQARTGGQIIDGEHPFGADLRRRDRKARDADEIADGIQECLRVCFEVVVDQNLHPLPVEGGEPLRQMSSVTTRFDQIAARGSGVFKIHLGRDDASQHPVVRIGALDGIAQGANYFAPRQISRNPLARRRRREIHRTQFTDRHLALAMAKVIGIPVDAAIVKAGEKSVSLRSAGR